MNSIITPRAAAYEQLENFECVLSDCTRALELNPKYVKALDRRAKVLRRQAEKMASAVSAGQVDEDGVVGKLTLALEDVTAGCILEGFQRQDHLMLVDAVLKELGEILRTSVDFRYTVNRNKST